MSQALSSPASLLGAEKQVRLGHSLSAGQTGWRSNGSRPGAELDEGDTENQNSAGQGMTARDSEHLGAVSKGHLRAGPSFLFRAGIPSHTHLVSNIPLPPKGPNPWFDSSAC